MLAVPHVPPIHAVVAGGFREVSLLSMAAIRAAVGGMSLLVTGGSSGFAFRIIAGGVLFFTADGTAAPVGAGAVRQGRPGAPAVVLQLCQRLLIGVCAGFTDVGDVPRFTTGGVAGFAFHIITFGVLFFTADRTAAPVGAGAVRQGRPGAPAVLLQLCQRLLIGVRTGFTGVGDVPRFTTGGVVGFALHIIAFGVFFFTADRTAAPVGAEVVRQGRPGAPAVVLQLCERFTMGVSAGFTGVGGVTLLGASGRDWFSCRQAAIRNSRFVAPAAGARMLRLLRVGALYGCPIGIIVAKGCDLVSEVGILTLAAGMGGVAFVGAAGGCHAAFIKAARQGDCLVAGAAAAAVMGVFGCVVKVLRPAVHLVLPGGSRFLIPEKLPADRAGMLGMAALGAGGRGDLHFKGASVLPLCITSGAGQIMGVLAFRLMVVGLGMPLVCFRLREQTTGTGGGVGI